LITIRRLRYTFLTVMHELQITQALLTKVLEKAGSKTRKIVVVKIVLGEFSGFVDESIDFYWNIITKDTIASGSKVVIIRKPGKMKCLACGHNMPKGEKTEICPKCGSFKVVVKEGSELVLQSIEVKND